MMKSFFKKLAFVMAMAMVVSLAAPAATASAAETKEFTYKYQNGLGAAVKTVNLAKTGDTVDLKFIGIPDYKDYALNWMSYGTGFELDVKTGVITATADEGEGVVWLSVGDDQTYTSQPVKVTIGELKATIGTQDKSNKDLGTLTLKVGEKEDLAFYGITDWNLGKYGYKWVIDQKSDVLTVDQKTGEITAVNPGEASVTFIAPNKFNQMNVVATNSLKVTVLPAKTTFEVDNGTTNVNTTEDDVDVYFSEAYDIEKVELYRVFEADDDDVASGLVTEYKNKYAYESIYVTNFYEDSKNDKHWTITPYVDFIDGETYEIRVDNLEPVQFVASVGAVTKVVAVELNEAVLAEEFEDSEDAVLGVKLYDAKGVLVNGAKVNGIENDSEEYITYTTENDEDGFTLTIDEITFYEDVVARVVATYDNGDADPVASKVLNVRPDDRDEYGIKEIVAWTIIDDTDTSKIDWKKTTQEMAANDTYRKLVVLFRDTRDQLYATDYRGVNDSYNGEDVYLTLTSEEYDAYEELLYNAEGTPFALNGCYVEFKAMDPDNLLIDVDGGIESYKKTNTRWGLYLYNYRLEDTQFDKEVFSATIKVKAERVMKKIDANSNNHTIYLFTEEEVDGTWSNAYYSVFSVGSVHFDLYDQYNASWGVDIDNVGTTVEDPHFEVTNLTNVAALDSLFQRYEDELNSQRADATPYADSTNNKVRDASIYFELNDFLDQTKTADANKDGSVNLADMLIAGKTITFRVTETVSGVSEKIVISIVEPNEYIKNAAGTKIPQDNAVIREELITKDAYAELFDIHEGNKITVNSPVSYPWGGTSTDWWTTKTLTLRQKDAKGYEVGFENNIVISNVKPSYNSTLKRYYIDIDELTTVDTTNGTFGTAANIGVGTKIIVTTMPNGTVLNRAVVGNTNAAYSAKELKTYGAAFTAPATAAGLGISFNTVETLAQDKTTTTYYNQYGFDFATVDATTGEIYYMPFGTYTSTVYTVEGFFYDENDVPTDVVLSGNSLFKQTSKFTFVDDMPEVTLAKRLNATTSVYLGAVDPAAHDEEYVKELIVDNFTFNWNGGTFLGNTKWDGIDTNDILCYTVQKSTNNQIVIKDVVFKVWVDWDGDKDTPDDNYWYRSTAAVNLSLTYVEEN